MEAEAYVNKDGRTPTVCARQQVGMLQPGGGTEFNLHVAAARRLCDL